MIPAVRVRIFFIVLCYRIASCAKAAESCKKNRRSIRSPNSLSEFKPCSCWYITVPAVWWHFTASVPLYVLPPPLASPRIEVFFPSLSSVFTALQRERRRWKWSVVKSFLHGLLIIATAGRPADRCCFVSILRPWEAAACSSFFSQIGLGLESVVLFLLSRHSESTASCLWQEELFFTLFLLLLIQNF